MVGVMLSNEAIYMLIFATLLVPPFVLSTRISVLMPMSVLLLLGAAHQVYVLKLPGEFWAHVLPGALLARAGFLVLRGRSGLFLLSWWQGLLGILFFVALVISEVYTTGLQRLGHLSHVMIFVASGSIVAGAAVHARLHRTGSASLAPFVLARVLLDSASLFGIGIVLIAHKHDSQPLAVAFHDAQGCMLILLAAAQLGGWAVNELTWREGEAPGAVATAVCMLQTTCWLLNAVWLIHMGAFLYLMPGRHGLHSVVWHDTPDVHETVNTYLAVDVWVCTVCTVCMHMQLHNSGGARSSFQVHAQGSAANYAKLPPNGEHVMREDLETAAEAALHMNGDDARLASAQT
uniref:Uncharacterized protein n=1 Tax=Chrysotila carterae TaxID=13221 RepID=A0A7S4B6H8_CHRCT